MTSDTSNHTADFSSSGPMGERIPSDRVLALGKKLVEEFGREESADTLGHWMAHYIAEKMEDAATVTGEARDRKIFECSEAILKLWVHRSGFPHGQRPFKEFEPIFRVLQSLNLDDTTPRYFPQVRSAVDQDSENDCTGRWLNTASEIDHAAKALIRYCLAIAAREAADKSKDWVVLAEAIAEENDFDIRTVRFIVSNTHMLNPKDPDDTSKSRAKELLKKLETFIALSAQLKEKLEQAVSEEKTPSLNSA